MKRRDFLRTAGGGAGVAAASATAPAVAAQEGGGSVTVDMTDGLAFEPASLTIPPDTTVVWENVGSAPHTVTAYGDEIPDDAEYFASGGFGSEEAARQDWAGPQEGAIGGGETYEHTFTVTGEYGYFCIPHESAGMTGTITVEEGASLPGEGGGGGGEQDPEHMGVPIQAHFVGIGTVLMVFVTLLFTFFLLKYGESPHASGGDQ